MEEQRVVRVTDMTPRKLSVGESRPQVDIRVDMIKSFGTLPEKDGSFKIELRDGEAVRVSSSDRRSLLHVHMRLVGSQSSALENVADIGGAQ